eukprot:g82643.t1
MHELTTPEKQQIIVAEFLIACLASFETCYNFPHPSLRPTQIPAPTFLSCKIFYATAATESLPNNLQTLEVMLPIKARSMRVLFRAKSSKITQNVLIEQLRNQILLPASVSIEFPLVKLLLYQAPWPDRIEA